MPCRLPVILALVVAILLGPGLTLAQDDPLQADTKTVNVELILDASGSMAEALPDGETRMAAAKRILRGVIEGLPEREGINVGLRVYGHLGDNSEAGKPVSCRSSELLVPVAGLDKAALIAQVEAIQPTGWTPIAYALEQAAADFQPGGESITNAIVLVTDGEETCDPPQQSCDAAGALRQAGIAVTTHVVGFALTPQQSEQVRCIAEQGGGQLFGADDAAGLGTAIGSALEGVGVSITPVAITPAAIPPAAPPVPLAEIRTLAYHQLTAWTSGANERGEEAPLLSDDGQRIAFTRATGSQDPANPNRIFVMNADGSDEREVDAYTALCGCGSLIDISADGSRIVSTDGLQLRIAEASGGGGRELLAVDSGELNAVRISGDGSRIVFRIYRDTSIRDTSPAQPIARGIYVINADGSGLRQIVDPAQMAALLGVPVEQAPFFGGSWGLDVSRDGSRVVFTSFAEIDPATGGAREGLFAVGGDGSGLRRLLGPTFTYVVNGAISGDGATVAYATGNAADDVQEAGVIGFDGSGQRALTDNSTAYPGIGVSLPSGERIQLSQDGSRLLLGSTGLLFDTASGDRLILGATTVSVTGDPHPLVVDGLYRPSMNAEATRFIYLFQPPGEPYQLARLDLNPSGLGGAPSVTEASVTSAFVLTETRSTATVSARVSTPNAFLRVGSRVLFRGLPDPNVNTAYYGPMVDDGASLGDAVAGDGVFTYDGVGTDCCAEVGPRIVRVKAETQAADGLRHATAVDVVPFAVVADPGVVPTVVPATIVTPAPGECRWTGTWSTAFGTMRLTESGPVEGVTTVSGDYDHDQGQIQGTVSGRVLSGTWTEAPSRQPPADAGHIEFTLAEDCQSFTGQWRYGFSGDWQPGWDGTRDATVEPIPATTAPPAAPAVPPTATVGPPTPVPPTPIPPTPAPAPTVLPQACGPVEFPLGDISFADAVVAYEPVITPDNLPSENIRDPQQALGPPNYVADSNFAGQAVTLGSGGRLTLQFLDNTIIGDGTAAPDLWIAEVGIEVEDTAVEVSVDRSSWVPLGTISGGTCGVDLDAFGFGPEDRFTFVRLTDDPNAGDPPDSTGNDSPGADIDAVGAISTAPVVTQPVTPAPVTPPVTPPGDDAAAQATIASQATRIAELEAGTGLTPTLSPAAVPPTIPPTVLPPNGTETAAETPIAVDRLGTRWDEREGEWTGIWTRRGTTNVFDAVWTHPSLGQVTAVLTITIEGDQVFVQRRQANVGGDCDYVGTLATDGQSVRGTYGCTTAPGPLPWEATITGLSTDSGTPTSPTGLTPTLPPTIPLPQGPETAPATPMATDFIAPDPAECTVTPRTPESLAAIAATPDQAAIDALAAARIDETLAIPDGPPADAATTAAVVETYRLMIACFNADNDLAAYALWTDDALRQIAAQPPTGEPTPLAEAERSAFRVAEVRMLADGRVVAVMEERNPLFSVTLVQVLERQGDRYVVADTVDVAATPPAATPPAAAPPAPTPPAPLTPEPPPSPTVPPPTATATTPATATTGTGTGEGIPPAADFLTPDPAECTIAPRTADELAALAVTPDQAAVDALEAAMVDETLTIPEGAPAEAATRAAVVETYRLMIACFNAGNDLAAYALWSDDALRQVVAEPPTGEPTPVPVEEREAFRVSEVRLLPDGRVVAVVEGRSPLFATTLVQVLERQGDRYIVADTVDIVFA